MANLEARRDARRKRILENSENRLNKISGVEQKKGNFQLDGYKNNENLENSSDLNVTESSNNNNNNINLLQIQHFPIPTSNFPRKLSLFSSNMYFKLAFLIFLAIFQHILLFAFSDTRGNLIFLPLLCYEIAQLKFTEDLNQTDSLNLVTIVLLRVFLQLDANFTAIMLKCYQSINSIINDCMLYFVAFNIISYFKNTTLLYYYYYYY